jgi:hypothetical protein
MVTTTSPVGPVSVKLAAAVAAEAADLTERARLHFEDALKEAGTMPHRLLQPTVRLWYGRFLASRRADDAAKGLTLLREAAEDFARLKMPLHESRAEQWLAAAQS